MASTHANFPNSNVEDFYVTPNGEERSTFVVLSGCSGGGKSTLLSELARRGFAVVPEPGRQIVKEQTAIGGNGLPGVDNFKLADLILSRSMFVFNSIKDKGHHVFFDRGVVDVIAYFDSVRIPVPEYISKAAQKYRYHRRVFLFPPWEDIFCNDSERKHSFAQASASYEAHVKAYERFGYEVISVPKATPGERADFILQHLDLKS